MKEFLDEMPTDQEVIDLILSLPEHYSANLVVDLGGAADSHFSIGIGGAGSGLIYAASGAVVGLIADMLNSDTYCNLSLAGTAVFTSGQLRVAVQTSDTTTSGDFYNPTSGLAAADLPTVFASGGIVWLNSGQAGGGVFGAQVSGQSIQSGFMAFAGFQRNRRYARAIVMSGDFYAGTLTAAFVSQRKTTGSGGGFSFSPSSGSVNV